jgi:hypothetical protein
MKISEDLDIVVRAPILCPRSVIDDFVQSHNRWIDKHIKIRNSEQPCVALSDDEIKMLKKKAMEILPVKTAYYSELMKLHPKYVKITSAQHRFGSCNMKNGICYSYKLMLYPEDAIDYVVVHELAHIKYREHSHRFYSLISQYMPDYKARDKMLKVTK